MTQYKYGIVLKGSGEHNSGGGGGMEGLYDSVEEAQAKIDDLLQDSYWTRANFEIRKYRLRQGNGEGQP